MFDKPITVCSKVLKDSAKGQNCTLRLTCCNHNPETTVLAHLPVGQKGMGMKRPDYLAVFACSDCHDRLDGRTKGGVEHKDMLRALGETQGYWVKKGLIKVEGYEV
jgi:hypothetical protein